MSSAKRTPLYTIQKKLGARFVDFGGWEMPVQFSSIVDEHQTVRRAAGIFDISHMGDIVASGPGAADFLNEVLTNDIRKLQVGDAQYSLMCNEQGGVIDDLYVYHVEEQKFLLIVNASRIEADWDWLQACFDRSKVEAGYTLNNVSVEYGAVAVQGPKSAPLMDLAIRSGSLGGKVVGAASELNKNEVGIFVLDGNTIYVARTGYTGEDGFEVIAESNAMESLWTKILGTGHNYHMQPAGLGARDTLRTEACYPLYGQDLSESITPLEAGLGFFVALDKPAFVGQEALREQKSQGLKRRSVAFQMTGKSAPPRPHYTLWSTNPTAEAIGEVTSGTQSPTLGTGIGLGLVPPDQAKPGTRLDVEIRGRKFPAEVTKKPFYRKSA